MTDRPSYQLAEGVRGAMTARGLTLGILESCTGGLLASSLTDVPGSGYLLGAGVAYDARVKGKFGVSGEVIEEFGLVSPEVAAALAEAAARWFGAEVGLGVTGAAGPEAHDGEEPGTAFAAVWAESRGAAVVSLDTSADRTRNKSAFVELTIGLLLGELERWKLDPGLSPGATVNARIPHAGVQGAD